MILTKTFKLKNGLRFDDAIPLQRFKTQVMFITDRFKAALLMWLFVLLVLVSVSVLRSPFMCLYDINFGFEAEWPPFRQALLIRLPVCSLCIKSICHFGCFQIWFQGLDCSFDCTSSSSNYP